MSSQAEKYVENNKVLFDVLLVIGIVSLILFVVLGVIALYVCNKVRASFGGLHRSNLCLGLSVCAAVSCVLSSCGLSVGWLIPLML